MNESISNAGAIFEIATGILVAIVSVLILCLVPYISHWQFALLFFVCSCGVGVGVLCSLKGIKWLMQS